MIDPITLTMFIAGRSLLEHNRCPVCRSTSLFSKWRAWECCKKAQCSACAEETEKTKCCKGCGSRVQ